MVDKRKEKNSASLLILRELLASVCQNPEAYEDDVELRSALKSQGRLAKYENTDLHISRSSINTFKRISDEYVDGGFDALDNLRKAALGRLIMLEDKGKRSNKRTRAGLVKRVDELNDDVMLLEQTNYLLVQAITEAITDVKAIASVQNNDARAKRSEETINKLTAMMAARPLALSQDPKESNIIRLNPKR